ncbi:MAG: sigma-54-dependent Fis family transcriptional regulator [Deltaproteobacteria bacterium]|nr:sigma-54-dependent Fis family transcriptional regulator [Deltaproteobacteria bacterium]
MTREAAHDQATVLVCDDEPAVRFAIAEVLGDAGHHVVQVASGAEAIAALADDPDVVVTDLSMPGVDGLGVLAAARARLPPIPVVLVTARGSERVAVQAMKAGALDYLAKPFDLDELIQTVARALDVGQLRASVRRAAAERASGRPMLGDSPVMRALFARVERVAGRDVTVLLRGDTGTGKELVASLLHNLGPRARGPFVRFNCAALPPELADAELFGHARGAFTGARDARVGFFARADGGTLVLDEVGELPPAVQPKLLRALQDGEIQPVGAGKVERVDVRIVASTHRDLRALVAAGRFREDLYYRLAVVELVVPRLEERRDDIPALARHFAARHAERFGLDEARLSDALCAALAARPWPGNVRELENTIGRLVALSDGGLIDIDALGDPGAPRGPEPAPTDGPAPGLRQQLEALERRLIGDALAAAGGNKAEAARRLGMSRVTLLDRMKRLGL